MEVATVGPAETWQCCTEVESVLLLHPCRFCMPRGLSVRGDFPQDEEKTPIKQDIKKGKLRFYPYNINWWGPSAAHCHVRRCCCAML